MVITKIERQKKNRARYSIFVDDRYAFSIGEEVYGKFLPYSGQELSEDERAAIEGEEEQSAVKRTALRFRSYRPRSQKEIEDHLRKKGFDDRRIAVGIGYLNDMKLLDDAEYARMTCRDRLRLKPVGRFSMKQLLMKKGVPRPVIETVLDELFTADSERALALKEAEKKFRRIASLPPLKQKKMIMEHLQRRGYDPSLSFTIAAQLVKQ